MAPIVIDLSGQRFGKLVVVRRVPRQSGDLQPLWACLCDCDIAQKRRAEVVVGSHALMHRATPSCGCARGGSKKIVRISIGAKFGRLTILSRISGPQVELDSNAQWELLCDCGARHIAIGQQIWSGRIRSCGCAGVKHGHARAGRVSITMNSYRSMLARCSDPNINGYENYGGRGIAVCDRWRESFENFLADMGERPGKGMTLDRFPNRDGNYEPGNVRWAPWKDQERSRRNNKMLTYRGETLCVSAWVEKLGISRHHLNHRLKTLSVDDAFSAAIALRSVSSAERRSRRTSPACDTIPS